MMLQICKIKKKKKKKKKIKIKFQKMNSTYFFGQHLLVFTSHHWDIYIGICIFASTRGQLHWFLFMIKYPPQGSLAFYSSPGYFLRPATSHPLQALNLLLTRISLSSMEIGLQTFYCHHGCNSESSYQCKRRPDLYHLSWPTRPSKKPFRAYHALYLNTIISCGQLN